MQSRPHLLWRSALCVEDKPRCSSSAIFFFPFSSRALGFFEFPMTDFYFVISKNDSPGDVFGRVFLVGHLVDSRAACFAVCANSCCRARQVWFVMHFFPSEKNTKLCYTKRFPAHFNLLHIKIDLKMKHDRWFSLNVLVTRTCRMSRSNWSPVAIFLGGFAWTANVL